MNSSIKKLLSAVLIATTCIFAAGCGGSDNNSASSDKKEIKMGVTAGPHAEVMEEVAKEAANLTTMYSRIKPWLKKIWI